MSWARVWAYVWLLLGTSALSASGRVAPAEPPSDADRDECLPAKSVPADQTLADSDKQDKTREWSQGPRVDVWDGPATRIASMGSGTVLPPALTGDRADYPIAPTDEDRLSFPVCHFVTGQADRCWLTSYYPHAPPYGFA